MPVKLLLLLHQKLEISILSDCVCCDPVTKKAIFPLAWHFCLSCSFGNWKSNADMSKNFLPGLLFNFSLYCLSSVNQTLGDWNQFLPLLIAEVAVKQISGSYLLGDSSVFSCKTKIAATKCVFSPLGFYVKTLPSFGCLTDNSSQMQHDYVSLLSFLQHTTGQSKT